MRMRRQHLGIHRVMLSVSRRAFVSRPAERPPTQVANAWRTSSALTMRCSQGQGRHVFTQQAKARSLGLHWACSRSRGFKPPGPEGVGESEWEANLTLAPRARRAEKRREQARGRGRARRGRARGGGVCRGDLARLSEAAFALDQTSPKPDSQTPPFRRLTRPFGINALPLQG